MQNNKGWIKLNRQLLDHQLWEETRKFSKAEAWIDLMLLANHKEKKVIIKNTQYVCGVGELLRSLDTLRKRWGWSKSAVRRFLEMLVMEEQIVTKNETQTTRITLCNYKAFQDSRNATEPDPEQERNADETQTAPNKNEKNEKNNNEVKKVIPPEAEKMPINQQKRIRVNYNNEIMDRIGSWFFTRKRLWTCHEAIMLRQLKPPQEEIDQLEKLYQSDYQYKRKSLATLLGNWAEELDRSHDYFKPSSKPVDKQYEVWRKNIMLP